MNRLAQQASSYLRSLGLPVAEVNRRYGRSLPYYVADAFDFDSLDIGGQPVLLAIDQEGQRSPAEVEQLMRKLGEVAGATSIYVAATLSSYERKRLIERRIPFLVPGNQLYVPGLGMDLREHFRKATPRRQLSPSAQAVLIAILQHPDWTVELTATEIAAKFDYTPMTASRAARELASAGLLDIHKASAGQMFVLMKPPKDTWTMALPVLRSPVLRTIYARMFAFQPPPSGLGDIVAAGIPALARRTMLAKEGPDVFACSRDSWKAVKKWVQVLPHPDATTDEVQIWSYPPVVKRDGRDRTGASEVDPLSLYLSLRDLDDPRVQSALEEVMEQVWQ